MSEYKLASAHACGATEKFSYAKCATKSPMPREITILRDLVTGWKWMSCPVEKPYMEFRLWSGVQS